MRLVSLGKVYTYACLHHQSLPCPFLVVLALRRGRRGLVVVEAVGIEDLVPGLLRGPRPRVVAKVSSGLLNGKVVSDSSLQRKGPRG